MLDVQPSITAKFQANERPFSQGGRWYSRERTLEDDSWNPHVHEHMRANTHTHTERYVSAPLQTCAHMHIKRTNRHHDHPKLS